MDRQNLPDVSLRALHVARVGMSPHDAIAGEHDKVKVDAPVTAYLLQHPAAGWFCVDAAFGRRTAADPFDYPGRTPAKLLDIRMDAPLADRLVDVDLRAEDIRDIFLTHLHHDHVGGVEDFPAARLHADPVEWAVAQRRSMLKGYQPSAFGGRPAIPLTFPGGPYGPFPRHEDVFGDGTFIALPAPGHTVGEACFLVNRPTRSYLLTGDAAWVDANWQRPAPVGWLPGTLIAYDWRLQCEQLWRIHAWAERYPEELVIVAGHEPRNLTGLPPWPTAFP